MMNLFQALLSVLLNCHRVPLHNGIGNGVGVGNGVANRIRNRFNPVRGRLVDRDADRENIERALVGRCRLTGASEGPRTDPALLWISLNR